MKCEYEYCVYHKKGECSLSEITINSQCSCDNRKETYINYEKLEELKKKTLEKIKKKNIK